MRQFIVYLVALAEAEMLRILGRHVTRCKETWTDGAPVMDLEDMEHEAARLTRVAWGIVSGGST